MIDLRADLLDGLTGHAMLIYQSADSYVHYMHQDKFFDFATKKGAVIFPTRMRGAACRPAGSSNATSGLPNPASPLARRTRPSMTARQEWRWSSS